MQPTYLIQRLNPPTKTDNPFSFGGGLSNGGLSAEAMDLVRPLCSFDYMGAGEFEFGRVPAAFNMMMQEAAKDNLCMAPFTPMFVWGKRQSLWYICRRDQHDEVMERIKLLASDKIRLKCPSMFRQATHPPKPGSKEETYYRKPETCGWLELNNGFMFFTDKDMWHGFWNIFRKVVVSSSLVE